MHVGNRKNNFLILGLGLTYGIDGSFSSADKRIGINFTKSNRKICLSFHYNNDNSYLFVNGKEIIKFKGDKKNVKFPARFRLVSISDGFSATKKYL